MTFVAATLLLYLGAVNSLLALNVGTCTQGLADEVGGGWISLVLFVIAAALMFFAQPRRTVLIALLPLAIPIWMQTVFTAKLGLGYFGRGISVCSILWNDPGLSFDGRESEFFAIWLVATLAALAGIGLAVLRAKQ